MNHIMFDLETWGTRAGCAVRSIGAVAFDMKGEGFGADFYMNIDDSDQGAALFRDPGTVAWWAQQSEESQAAFTEPHPVPLSVAASAFRRWFQLLGGTYIWSHGACFDVPVWEYAVSSVGGKVPWRYWDVRDTRTLFALADFDLRDLPFDGIEHNALDDAKHQARGVQLAWQRIFTPQVTSPPLTVVEPQTERS